MNPNTTILAVASTPDLPSLLKHSPETLKARKERDDGYALYLAMKQLFEFHGAVVKARHELVDLCEIHDAEDQWLRPANWLREAHDAHLQGTSAAILTEDEIDTVYLITDLITAAKLKKRAPNPLLEDMRAIDALLTKYAEAVKVGPEEDGERRHFDAMIELMLAAQP